MDRRRFFGSLGAGLASVILGSRVAEAGPRARGRARRMRRRVRRRIRRRVAIRMVRGRPFWVVPVGLAAGWELMHENRIVVVKETKFVEIDGARTEVAIVQDSDGKTEQVALAREDTAVNKVNLEGSVLPEGDTKTPAIEKEADSE
ncbi:MAG: hypothetical protein ACRD16_14910 [Thermoanaerobaculia bacterium]